MGSNPTVKTLMLIHMVLILGLVLFSIVVFFITENWEMNVSNMESPFFLIVPIVTLATLFLGNFLFKSFINKIDANAVIKSKLTQYQTAMIIKDALIEAPCLIAIIAAMLTGNLVFYIVVGALIVYFYSQRPTINRIERDLQLDSNMIAELQNS